MFSKWIHSFNYLKRMNYTHIHIHILFHIYWFFILKCNFHPYYTHTNMYYTYKWVHCMYVPSSNKNAHIFTIWKWVPWFYLFFFKFYFIFKLYKIVLVFPNIKMNPPQVYMCSPSWTLLPPPSPYYPSGSSQCTSPKHPVSCIEPGLWF